MSKKEIKDELLDHDFDGIQEFDNSLPPWWLNLFYFTIVFGVIYFAYYHIFDGGSIQKDYAIQMAKIEKVQKEIEKKEQALVLKPSKDQMILAKGKTVFTTNCAACHGQNAQGIVGPNLTDDYWLHGGKYPEIIKTITKGVPAKGMIAWGGVLSKDQIKDVASYIWSLHGSKPENPKDPQGKKVER